MTAVQELIDAVKALGVTLRADGSDIKIRPAGVLPDELKDRLREHKPELLAHLTAAATTGFPYGKKTPSNPEKGQSEAPETQICFHCAGLKNCDCIICNSGLSLVGDAFTVKPGPCLACRGVKP